MNKNIKIFYHVLLENHWYSVVNEQLSHIKESGILEHTSCFYISLSTPDNIDNIDKSEVIQFFYDHFINYVYPEDIFYGKKFEVLECNKSEFEYPTLEKAIEISKLDKNFTGFYFHTKGVSRPGYKKDHTRNAMNIGCIDNWQDHVDKILEGYDMSGINMFDGNTKMPEFRRHYSGNFFFFNPSFFSMIDFSIIDKSNRFYAESMYGIFYNPKFFSLGIQGLNTPFIKDYIK